jgi:hypothetical protein
MQSGRNRAWQSHDRENFTISGDCHVVLPWSEGEGRTPRNDRLNNFKLRHIFEIGYKIFGGN